MNGADALLQTFVANDVTACFANPGTSEMQFVAALDREPRMRPVLCLFEGVVTGAADGYGRIADKPACTLLHLGPGYGNGVANLHNARRAFTPIVNVIGDHATYHRQHDAPLNSDIFGLARPNSLWIKSADRAEDIPALAAEAVAAKPKAAEQTVYLRVPGVDSPAFRHVKLVMSMFEGEAPVKIRLADTGKMLLAHCLVHPALLEELRKTLGPENVVVK